MSRLLITDTIPLVFDLHESETVNGSRKLRGLFHLAEVKNANGRIYPKHILEREIDRIMPAVRDRRVLGELDHPTDPRIHLDKSSHVISNLKMDGTKIFGELEALKTPCGKILEGLIDSGIKLGISSRGLGSLKENQEGIKIVQEDYGLVTWDVVPNPSTPDAWLGESSESPIVISLDSPMVENDFIEFGGEIEKIETTHKINVDSIIRERISELFGGN